MNELKNTGDNVDLQTIGIDMKRFIKVNIRDRSLPQLKALAEAGPALDLVGVLFQEIQQRAINEISLQSVNANAFDISEKIKLAGQIATDKSWYTISKLHLLAQAEIKRRLQKKAVKKAELP